MSSDLQDLTKFLQLGARFDLKSIAVNNVLSLTASEEGCKVIHETPQILTSLIALLGDKTKTIASEAALSLINVSASKAGADSLISLNTKENCPPLQSPPGNIVEECLNIIFNPESCLANQACVILSNLTTHSHIVEKVVDIIGESNFDKLIKILTNIRYNKRGCDLHYLGALMSNLSQSYSVRKMLLNNKNNYMQKLLPFTTYNDSIVRRTGIVATIKNCCFEDDYHDYLLSDEIDILPYLLLPLAGNEEFDDEDNNKLPVDLQYLPEDKKREEDSDVRLMLIEALTRLVSKRKNREFVREKNAYVILRELHKWEKEKAVLNASEALVNILIRTEEEIGLDDLKDVEVPVEVSQGFDKE